MKKRNSSIELLRIISMFFIIMHHACISDAQKIFAQSISINNIVRSSLEGGEL